MGSYTGNSIICMGPEEEIGAGIQEEKAEDAMAIIKVGKVQSRVEPGQHQQLSQLNAEINDEDWRVGDVTPISVQHHNSLPNKEMNATLWVHQNLIRLSKRFGVDFQGHEEETLELLLQIDSCRQIRRMESESDIKKNRFKGSQINYGRYSLISEVSHGQCPLRSLKCSLVGMKLELELEVEIYGGLSLHVYGGQSGRRGTLDVLRTAAIQCRRSK
ncbi:PREDICTED: uncharacterized protein LOC109230508 [Nicotiana attenuata]|uniref:uncharacterized protein LOC109230508 n=1 Tax=Nicotiana attenuata TaxID=49451 RepID=UPI00090509C5|nr:PREDICTED: uncharacterized protein LOC109230508 [Nicotiana attenuata]